MSDAFETDSERNGRVDVERGVESVMRDGTILRADVYRPAEIDDHPVLLCRTPYDKLSARLVNDALVMARRGYVVVLQDARGRFASDGEFLWQFRDRDDTYEANDGYDSVEWAAGLDGSNGTVGLWGHSYDGWNAWMAASTQPPSLAALAATGISVNLLDLTPGIFETGRRLLWTSKMAADMRRRAGRKNGPTTPEEAVDRWMAVDRSKYMWRLPIADVPADVFDDLTEQFQTYLRNQHLEYWHLDDFHPIVNVPVLQVTGWWDRLIGATDHFTGLVRNGREELRSHHRLVIGPWGHDVTEFGDQIGPVDLGPGSRIPYAEVLLRWFDHVVKGTENGIDTEDPVQLFVLGSNEWRGEKTWPPEGTDTVVYHLTSDEGANTIDGDGRLADSAPHADGADVYAFDPSDPVMSLMSADFQASPVDQSPRDHRQDVLVYETEPFDRPLDFIGTPALHLWAATDGPDTDWAVTLAIVHADGLAVNLTYGIVRARYRNGYTAPAFLEPNRPYEYRIELNPVGCQVQVGERLRLYVASSDFPNFDRNHNNGADFWDDDELRVANQTVFHGPARPSRLELPLLPPGSGR